MRIARTTLTIGVAILLTAGGVALWSTSRLSAEKVSGRQIVAGQIVEDRIEGRLRQATASVQQSALALSRITSNSMIATTVAPAWDGAGGTLVELDVIDSRGELLYGLPRDIEERSANRDKAFKAALAGATFYFVEATGPDRPAELWIARTSLGGDRLVRVVIGRLDMARLAESLDQGVDALDSGAVALLQGDQVLMMAGGELPAEFSQARWSAGAADSGTLRLRSPSGTFLSGRFNTLQAFEGLAWRIVVVEPSSLSVADTFSAVTPYLAVLALGGVIALGVAWVLGLRIARPLRELERAARSAAAGSYVRPLTIGGEDEIGRVAEAFNAVAVRLNSLHDLSQLMASASQLDQVLDGILSAMGHIIGPGASAVYLLDEGEGELRPVRTRGVGLANAQPVEAGTGGWFDRALEDVDPTVFRANSDDVAHEVPGIAGDHQALLAAPLVAGSEPLGVVIVLLDHHSSLSEAELEMVRTFSAQASVAVQNSRLFAIETESRKTAEALRAVAEALVSPVGIETAFASAEQIAAELFGATLVRIVLVDRTALGLQPLAESAVENGILAAALDSIGSRAGEGPVRLWHGSGRPIDDLLDEYDALELVAVPISLETDHGAVMVVLLPSVGAGTDVIGTATAIGDEVALALDNAYFYERAIARAANLETIFRISQAVGSSLQLNVVLNRVLDVVQKILSADAVALLLYDSRKRQLTTSMARGHVPTALLHLEVSEGEDLPGRVYASGEPVIVNELHPGMDGVAGSAASGDLRSLVAVPLLARGRSIGVLMVFAMHESSFTHEDTSLLQTFASQAALSIDTARLYSHEHDVARVLQDSIIPGDLPHFDEIQTGAVYGPAGGDADIGGDYYDVFRAPDGRLWFVIADVCGKGVQAATKTSMIKYAVRALVAAALDPAAVMTEVNRMTAEAGEPSDIVTAWIGRYDPAASTLEWADGGHPPGLLKRADGVMERLGPTGPLLGAVADVEFELGSVAFGSGDNLLLYTDGVTEAREGNTFFGETRIAEVFSSAGTPEQTVRNLYRTVRAYVKTELRDDVAILAVSVGDGLEE